MTDVERVLSEEDKEMDVFLRNEHGMMLGPLRAIQYKPKSLEVRHRATNTRCYVPFSVVRQQVAHDEQKTVVFYVYNYWVGFGAFAATIERDMETQKRAEQKWAALALPETTTPQKEQEKDMGMSTHVIGFVPPDEKWQKMKAIWDACSEADIDPPEEVEDFFNGEPPDEAGVEVKIEKTPAVSVFTFNEQSGFEVDIDKLPKHIKVIRFYNAW